MGGDAAAGRRDAPRPRSLAHPLDPAAQRRFTAGNERSSWPQSPSDRRTSPTGSTSVRVVRRLSHARLSSAVDAPDARAPVSLHTPELAPWPHSHPRREAARIRAPAGWLVLGPPHEPGRTSRAPADRLKLSNVRSAGGPCYRPCHCAWRAPNRSRRLLIYAFVAHQGGSDSFMSCCILAPRLRCSTSTRVQPAVNGHQEFPTGGHLFSPAVAMFSPRWWP